MWNHEVADSSLWRKKVYNKFISISFYSMCSEENIINSLS